MNAMPRVAMHPSEPTRQIRSRTWRAACLAITAASAAGVLVGCGPGGGGDATDDSTEIASPAEVSATDADPAGPEACGTSGSDAVERAEIGRQEVALASGGFDRTYVLYVPSDGSDETPAPVILDLPAYSPASMEEAFSGFTTPDAEGQVLADEVGAVVVTPEPIGGDGALRAWNLTDQPQPAWPDDHAFIAEVMADVAQRTCIDPDRVLATGFAVGGSMAAEVACRNTIDVAVLATVSGLYDPDGCDPAGPIPVIEFHGTADRFIPYDGGIGSGVGNLGLGPETSAGLAGIVEQFRGAVDASEGWAEHNGCDPTPADEDVTDAVTTATWTGCADDATVQLYTIEGGEHTWPSSLGMDAYTDLLGPVSTDVDATARIWEFFAEQTEA